MPDVVIATATVWVSEFECIRAGSLYEATHPQVRAHPELFSADLIDYAIRAPEEVHVRTTARAARA
jgi:hypothetical protein